MKNSLQVLNEAGVVPQLRLATQTTTTREDGSQSTSVVGTGPHTVALVSDEIVEGTDFHGEQRKEMKFTFKENGVLKTYNAPLRDTRGNVHYLIERLGRYKAGSTVILEYKQKGTRGYIDVTPVKVEEEMSTVATINDNEDVTENPKSSEYVPDVFKTDPK